MVVVVLHVHGPNIPVKFQSLIILSVRYWWLIFELLKINAGGNVAISHVTKRYNSEGVSLFWDNEQVCTLYHLMWPEIMVGNYRPIGILEKNAESTMLEGWAVSYTLLPWTRVIIQRCFIVKCCDYIAIFHEMFSDMPHMLCEW